MLCCAHPSKYCSTSCSRSKLRLDFARTPWHPHEQTANNRVIVVMTKSSPQGQRAQQRGQEGQVERSCHRGRDNEHIYQGERREKEHMARQTEVCLKRSHAPMIPGDDRTDRTKIGPNMDQTSWNPLLRICFLC